MWQLRAGIYNDLNVTEYADPKLHHRTMLNIRHRLIAEQKENITIALYGDEKNYSSVYFVPDYETRETYPTIHWEATKLTETVPLKENGRYLVDKDDIVRYFLIREDYSYQVSDEERELIERFRHANLNRSLSELSTDTQLQK